MCHCDCPVHHHRSYPISIERLLGLGLWIKIRFFFCWDRNTTPHRCKHKQNVQYVPIRPPIRKQINWQISNETTRMDNFLVLKFSRIVPVILDSVFLEKLMNLFAASLCFSVDKRTEKNEWKNTMDMGFGCCSFCYHRCCKWWRVLRHILERRLEQNISLSGDYNKLSDVPYTEFSWKL